MFRMFLSFFILVLFHSCPAFSLERPDKEFKIFQFPADRIPRIDGDTSDWSMVPPEYAIGSDELLDTVNGNPRDTTSFDATVKVGWVKGLDRLYFLYEAYDDYWDFERPGLSGDIFEVVVDGDCSGGPLIPRLRKDNLKSGWEGHMLHGVHAQNYHIFTPAVGKQWCMPWGCQPWIAELPWSNAAYSYTFRQGESGRLILEFWITPFDYAPYEGPGRAIVSRLRENGIVGLAWTILENDRKSDPKKRFAFWSLSHTTTMYGNASELVAFRLMPLEKQFRKPVEAHWEFSVIDPVRRVVAFKDRSYGNVTSWKWDFGDGTTSTEQNPIHEYKGPAVGVPNDSYQYHYVVILTVGGPEGSSRFSRVWEVAVRE
jgi:hypothetical protein